MCLLPPAPAYSLLAAAFSVPITAGNRSARLNSPRSILTPVNNKICAGPSPVAMRRRVMLERAAWQLREGASVTDAAIAAGYESVEGFSRAFTRAWPRPGDT